MSSSSSFSLFSHSSFKQAGSSFEVAESEKVKACTHLFKMTLPDQQTEMERHDHEDVVDDGVGEGVGLEEESVDVVDEVLELGRGDL